MHEQKSNAWHLRDVILLTLTAILTGVIYFGVVFLYNGLTALLTPLGLAPFGNDLILGLWTMAAPLAACLLQKIGSATIGEILAAAVEAILGGQWGISTLISGFVQGFGSELGFTFTAYKRYDMFSLSLSALTTTIVTFAWDLFREGYAAYHGWMIIALFFTRLLSIWLFGALLVHAVVSLLERSHMLRAE
ncbi:ECF transporter S component [Ligilactobacillus acidipiscis]|jgi:energy-coupling factor transport system substrate-specific component|uniref:ECF transporter S component n=1 Tax=Ligilactobacillus acidipiscis TaxID=89059 RepID=UPI002FD9AF5C